MPDTCVMTMNVRWSMLLGACLVLACSSRVSQTDARELLKSLEALDQVEGPDTKTRLLYSSCGEIKSCAAGCERAFKAFAAGEIDPSLRAPVLGECSDDFKKRRAEGTTPDRWFREYLSAYCVRAQAALGTDEQKRLASACARVGGS